MGALTNDIIDIVEKCRTKNEVKPQHIAKLTQLGVPMTKICQSIDAYVLSDIVIDYAFKKDL